MKEQDDIKGAPAAAEPGERKDHFLGVSILVAAILISGSVLYAVGKSGSAEKVPAGAGAPLTGISAPSASERDVVLGDADAPITLIEYGDYQCPICDQFFVQVEDKLRDEYIKPGKVRMIFRNFIVIDNFVPGGHESRDAAEAAECAKDQRQYWAYHDALYRAEGPDGKENSGNLTRDLFIKIAGDLKLDVGAFTDCFDSKKYADLIEKDVIDAQALGINSTPTVFINGQKFVGLPRSNAYETYKSAIESELGKK